MIPKNCIVCSENSSKYKCPKCSDPYCSVNCFKNHKCEPKINESIPEEKFAEDREPQSIHLFTTVDTVKAENLEKLRESHELKALLENPHLRNYLKEIDQAPNAWKTIKAAMFEPLFLEFADVCLKIVDNPDEDSEL